MSSSSSTFVTSTRPFRLAYTLLVSLALGSLRITGIVMTDPTFRLKVSATGSGGDPIRSMTSRVGRTARPDAAAPGAIRASGAPSARTIAGKPEGRLPSGLSTRWAPAQRRRQSLLSLRRQEKDEPGRAAEQRALRHGAVRCVIKNQVHQNRPVGGRSGERHARQLEALLPAGGGPEPLLRQRLEPALWKELAAVGRGERGSLLPGPGLLETRSRRRRLVHDRQHRAHGVGLDADQAVRPGPGKSAGDGSAPVLGIRRMPVAADLAVRRVTIVALAAEVRGEDEPDQSRGRSPGHGLGRELLEHRHLDEAVGSLPEPADHARIAERLLTAGQLLVDQKVLSASRHARVLELLPECRLVGKLRH